MVEEWWTTSEECKKEKDWIEIVKEDPWSGDG